MIVDLIPRLSASQHLFSTQSRRATVDRRSPGQQNLSEKVFAFLLAEVLSVPLNRICSDTMCFTSLMLDKSVCENWYISESFLRKIVVLLECSVSFLAFPSWSLTRSLLHRLTFCCTSAYNLDNCLFVLHIVSLFSHELCPSTSFTHSNAIKYPTRESHFSAACLPYHSN